MSESDSEEDSLVMVKAKSFSSARKPRPIIISSEEEEEDESREDVSEEDESREDVSEEDESREDISEEDESREDISEEDESREVVSEEDESREGPLEEDESREGPLEEDVSEEDESREEPLEEDESRKGPLEEDESREDVSEEDESKEDPDDSREEPSCSVSSDEDSPTLPYSGEASFIKATDSEEESADHDTSSPLVSGGAGKVKFGPLAASTPSVTRVTGHSHRTIDTKQPSRTPPPPSHSPPHPPTAADDNNKENKGGDTKKKVVGEEKVGFEVGFQFRKLVKQLYEQQTLFDRYGPNLPDKGYSIRRNIDEIKKRMVHLRGYVPSPSEIIDLLRQQPEETETAQASRVVASSTLMQPPLRKGLMVHAQAKLLTSAVVSNLHSTLSSRPTEDMLTDDPPRLKVPLMKHQKSGLTFLMWREEQSPKGGILADDMGLGKTLSMIALIVKTKGKTAEAGRGGGGPMLQSKGTLVIAPLTLTRMWEEEIVKMVYPGTLSVFLYHGPKRPEDPRELLMYDVVITTYNIVGMEGNAINEATVAPGSKKRSATPVLFHIRWNRIILDEAHTIRNPKSATSIGCCSLDAEYRWALTGTPIQNKLKDFYSLIKFLRVSPFDDMKVWKDTIEGKGLGMKRLQAMVSCLVLRRVKEEFESTKLPDKTVVIHKVALNEEERSVYNVLFHFSRNFFMKYLDDLGENVQMLLDSAPSVSALLMKVPPRLRGSVTSIMDSMIPDAEEAETSRRPGSMILILLLRLRQCCNHPHLLSTALSPDVLADDDLSLAMGSLAIEANTGVARADTASLGSQEFFNEAHLSSKVQFIIEELNKIIHSDDPSPALPNKCIIVSQWTTMLQVLEHHLILAGISFTKITGKVSVKDRQDNISAFNRSSRNPRVMLLSLQAGGVGLTLTGANHVFITDLHWNPQLEQQASDRCHRVGQTRNVIIHRFMTQNTVEAVISIVQDKKLKLATDVLEGTTKRGKKGAGLTMEDLRMLFELS